MAQRTGNYRDIVVDGEALKAFLPQPLPPAHPSLRYKKKLKRAHAEALAALGRLGIAAALVPSAEWLLYGFVRKEAVVSCQIEGTRATVMDVVIYEATQKAERPADMAQVCGCVDALSVARAELSGARPIGAALLCAAHARLTRGERGEHPGAGELRTRQRWMRRGDAGAGHLRSASAGRRAGAPR